MHALSRLKHKPHTASDCVPRYKVPLSAPTVMQNLGGGGGGGGGFDVETTGMHYLPAPPRHPQTLRLSASQRRGASVSEPPKDE